MKSDLQFIHIPKNAGTYIAKLGKLNGFQWGCENEALMNHEMIPNVPSNHVPVRHIDGIDIYKNVKTFCVIRNPFDKLVSAYKFLMFHQIKKPFDKETLNKFVLNLQDELAKNKFVYEGHFLPQYEFIFDDDGVRICDTILCFENLHKGIEYIDNKYDLKLSNRPSGKINQSDYSNLTRYDLNNDSIAIIKKIYAQDFELKELVEDV